MTRPGDDDSSVQIPPRQGQTPDNINIYPRPPFPGEGPSGSDAPPIPATESPPLILGSGHYRPPLIRSHHRSSAIGRGPLPAPSLGYNMADPSVIVGDGFVLQIGSHGERINGGGGRIRKRTREGASGAGSSRVVGDHNPILLPPPPPELGPFGCIVCKNQFLSDRSLSGHMRIHNDRDWRGTNYPPPTFSMQEFYDDDNARAHLNSPLTDEEDGLSRVVDEPPGLEENVLLNESGAHVLNPPPLVLQVVEGPISYVDQTGMELEKGEITVGDINKDLNHPEEQCSKVDILGPSNPKKAELPDLNKEPPPDCD